MLSKHKAAPSLNAKAKNKNLNPLYHFAMQNTMKILYKISLTADCLLLFELIVAVRSYKKTLNGAMNIGHTKILHFRSNIPM